MMLHTTSDDQPPAPGRDAAGTTNMMQDDRASGRAARSSFIERGARYASYAFGAVLLGTTLLIATATLPSLFGYHTYIIEGRSMEPSLRLGSVAVAHPASSRALEVGDVIVRRDSPDAMPVLHRIVDVQEVDGERLFITQGDQNATPDPEPVLLQGSGDKVVYSVPYAGYVLSFAQSWPGRILLIGVPLVLLTGGQLWELIHRRKAAPASDPTTRLASHIHQAGREREVSPETPRPTVMQPPVPEAPRLTVVQQVRSPEQPAPVAHGTSHEDLPDFLIRQLAQLREERSQADDGRHLRSERAA